MPSCPIVFGVAGGTASGKTTMARHILARAGAGRVAYLPHDAYYRDMSALPQDQRPRQNYDHPDSLETSLLVQHIKTLRAGFPIQLPIYDFTSYSRAPQTKTIAPAPVILVDGILILAEPELRNIMDIKIFVDTDADIRILRRIQRDTRERGRTLDSVIAQYFATVRPMDLEFVQPSRRYADLIIPGDHPNPVAIDMLMSRLRRIMDEPNPSPTPEPHQKKGPHHE